MENLTQGARVRIKNRPVKAEDWKHGTYYAHYAGLPGSITHVYADDEVAVEIDQEALPTEIRKRLKAVRDQMKTKWLDGLSEEGRNRLTEREKDFRLRYVILVSAKDIEEYKDLEPVSTLFGEMDDDGDADPPRATSDDIQRAEDEELSRRSERSRG